MLITSPRKAHLQGFSLVELMVAITIGLLILAGIGSIFGEFVKSNSTMLKTAHLQQTLWSLISVMTEDIRRAGYWSRAELTLDGASVNRYAPAHVVAGDCILYSYDQDKDDTDGAPDAEDQHGFRLRGGRLQIKTSDEECGPMTCTGCDSGNWWSLTDPQSLRITSLSFTLDEHVSPFDGGGHAAVAREIGIVLEGAMSSDPQLQLAVSTAVAMRNDEIR